jgi:hypothetical protein
MAGHRTWAAIKARLKHETASLVYSDKSICPSNSCYVTRARKVRARSKCVGYIDFTDLLVDRNF